VHLDKLKEGTLEIIVGIHLMLHRINVDVESKRGGCGWVRTTVMWPIARSWTVFKPTLPQGSRSDLTYVVPVVVNCSYCTPDDGYGKYPKHVEWSCNKIKILVLHLVGHFVCIYIENDARNHEPKILYASCYLGIYLLNSIPPKVCLLCSSLNTNWRGEPYRRCYGPFHHLFM
jgi:hypothetical protein